MRIRVLTLNLWNVNEPLAARMSALAAASCGLAHAVDNDALSILSRFPVVRSQSAPLPEAPRDEPRQVLLAEVLIEGRPLLVANTHLAWRPKMIVERKAQVLLAAIERQGAAHDAKILCGDFNDDPDSPALRAVLESGLGFHGVYTLCRSDDPGFRWSRQNPDQRIDYIFSAGALVPQDCAVVFNGGNRLGFASDHFGVFCNLEFR
jgi:endonuclease/exonuclease/phosphatase family metal-dependent hydrolase